MRTQRTVAVEVFTEAGHEGKTYTISAPELLPFGQDFEKLSGWEHGLAQEV